MSGISRYEKAVLGVTAAFVLFTGGWFLREQQVSAPYEVTTVRSAVEEVLPESEEEQASETPDSLLEGELINLNTADLYDLQRLPGIGEKRAQAILDDRAENGPFQTVEELTRVSGIGEGILAQLRDYATVE
jgi:competence protein ComEA